MSKQGKDKGPNTHLFLLMAMGDNASSLSVIIYM